MHLHPEFAYTLAPTRATDPALALTLALASPIVRNTFEQLVGGNCT